MPIPGILASMSVDSGPSQIVLGLTIETDTSFVLDHTKLVTLGLVSETDTTFNLFIDRFIELALASETDTVFNLIIDVFIELALASETDTAFVITPKLSVIIPVGLASETDIAIGFILDFFAHVRQNAAQAILDGTGDAAITWETEISDIQNIHSTSSNNTRFTIPSAWDGRYCRLSFGVLKEGGQAPGLSVYGTLNGSTFQGAVRASTQTGGQDNLCGFSAIIQVFKDDYFEVFSTDDVRIQNDAASWGQVELMPITFNGALVSKTTDQELIPFNVDITYETENYDLGGWFDGGANNKIFTVPSGVSLVRLISNSIRTIQGDHFVLKILNGAGAHQHGLPFIDIATDQREAANVVSAPIAVSASDTFKSDAFSGLTSNLEDSPHAWFSVEALPSDLKYAIVGRSSSQFLGSLQWTAVNWNLGVVDTSNWHDLSSNISRMTVPAGVSRVRLTANYISQESESGQSLMKFQKNGTGDFNGMGRRGSDTPFNDAVNTISAILDVVEGDYFEVEIFVTTNSNVGTSTASWFSIEEVPSSIGLPVETDTAFVVIPILGIIIQVGLTSETDTAFVVTPVQV